MLKFISKLDCTRLLLMVILPVGVAVAVQPAWWADQSVLDSGGTVNDYAAVNLGQVKNIAHKAYLELEATAPGGAGTTLDNLIASWLASPGQGVSRHDYASINQGQLKTVAKLFYDRLAELGYTGQPLTGGQVYPWTDITTDDNSYAAANIGQVKYLFSFDTALIDPDTDGDGLIDPDTDGDGLTDSEEATLGTDPTTTTNSGADSDNDGFSDTLEQLLGTGTGSGNSADPGNSNQLDVHRPIE